VLFGLRAPETRPAALHAPGAADAVPLRGWRSIVHPGGILPGLVLLASTTGMGGFFAFGKLYADSLGMDGAGPIFATLAVIVIVFRSLMPWMPDRLGARRAASIALTFNAAGMVIIGLWAEPAGFYAGTAVFAFGVCFAFPALSTLTTLSVPPGERGAALGTFSAFLDLGFGAAPVLLGFIAQAAGFTAVFLASAVVAASGLLLLAATRPVRSVATSTG
jgi:MFS family permease